MATTNNFFGGWLGNWSDPQEAAREDVDPRSSGLTRENLEAARVALQGMRTETEYMTETQALNQILRNNPLAFNEVAEHQRLATTPGQAIPVERDPQAGLYRYATSSMHLDGDTALQMPHDGTLEVNATSLATDPWVFDGRDVQPGQWNHFSATTTNEHVVPEVAIDQYEITTRERELSFAGFLADKARDAEQDENVPPADSEYPITMY